MAAFRNIIEEVDFYRCSVALFAFGIALLSGVFPILLKEKNKKHWFSALLCFAGSYFFTLGYLRNFHQEKTDIETVCVVLGCLTAMLCKILLVPDGTVVNLPTFDELDTEESEIEMMLPSNYKSTKQDDVADITGFDDTSNHRIIVPNHENRCVVVLCFLASFLFNVGDGVDFASKEHVGYGKLIATVLNAALTSTSQGTLQTRNVYTFSRYGLWIFLLALGHPVGIALGAIAPTILANSAVSIAIALSRGVLLFVSVACLVGSQFHAGGPPAESVHTIGILTGGALAITTCVYF